LSSLDYPWVAYYTPILCTFALTGVEHNLDVVQHLRNTLADALVLFYPLAGRVFARDSPPRIHCNDAGAVFTEASVDVELADLRVDDFQPQPVLSGLAAAGLGDYPVLPQIDTGLPALVIQVTHFKCGGLTLAVNWAHAVADGQAGFHFIKSWSELARGLQVSLLPDHRRELVKPGDSSRFTTRNLFKTSSVLSPGAQIMKNSNLGSSGDFKPEVGKPAEVVSKTFEFTGDEISKLKQLDSEQLSRADCLSTHLWRSIARTRNLQRGSAASLVILVEGRKKLSLPPGYFGNVINFLCVITTVSELLHRPFGCTARLVHSAVRSVTTERFQDLVDFMPLVLQPGKTDFSTEDSAFPGMTSLGISYLNHFPFYELDFGFGVPVHSTRNTLATRDGLLFVVPSSRGRENMVVMANIDSQDMSNFLSTVNDIPSNEEQLSS